MRRLLAALVLVGCSSGSDDDGSFVIPGNDTADTGADTDTDTNPPAPCPFEGSWTIEEAACNEGTIQVTGSAHVEGTAEQCSVRFEGTAPSGCTVVEQVELLSRPLGFWEAYSDGAPGSTECLSWPGGAQSLGAIKVEHAAGTMVWTYSSADEVGLRITDPCLSRVVLTMEARP